MSATPRTDRYAAKAEDYTQQIVVPAAFARRLEEELAVVRDTLKKLRADIGATPSGEPQYLLRPKFEQWCAHIDASL